jgi:hypothetical protein
MENEQKLDNAFYINESKQWLTALNELRSENIRLKNSLSQAISHEVSLEFVELAERFQHRFIEKDQVIDLLRHDLSMLQHKLSTQQLTRTEECAVLKKDIEQLIDEFHRMKTSFARFLATDRNS